MARPVKWLTARRFITSEIVHIKVGTDLEDFGVHKDFICHYSPYFKAAFTSGFEETKTGIMILPETKPEVFKLFCRWLYTGSLWNENGIKDSWPDVDCLIEVYIFADMAQLPPLMNQTLDTLRKISDLKEELPSPNLMAYAWNNTTDKSQLRRLLIDWIVWEVDIVSIDEDWVDTLPSQCVGEMLKGLRVVAKRYAKTTRGMQINPLLITSNYHVPVKEEKDLL